MAEKKLIFVLNCSQDYIKHTGEDEEKYAAERSILFESISNTYIPLVRMLEAFCREELSVKIGLVLNPVLCTLLEDTVIQEQYLEWLDKKIDFGKEEIKRCSFSEKLSEQAKRCLEKSENDKALFLEYKCRLVKKFSELSKKGYLELIATCGTDIFLPYYNDMPEIINAQVEAGIFAFRSFFGNVPDGFWLPELGYYNGVEKILRAYGINYTILDSRSFLFSEIEPKKGLFGPARFANALVAFCNDPETDRQIYGDDGYSKNENYLETERDIGFTLKSETLESFVKAGNSRYAIGYKYWNKASADEENLASPDDCENIYDVSLALDQVKKDAEDFVESKFYKLSKAEEILSDSDEVSMLITINANLLEKYWSEGILWLEEVIRLSLKKGIVLGTPNDKIEDPFKLQRISPCYAASSGVGYGENLLSSKNNWMMRYVRKASERMVDLSERFPTDTGLKARLLNLGAKELMFAQSSGWAKMIHEGNCPEYAEMRFKQSINDFTSVFDALGSNTVSTEWLTSLETQHQIFPWMNYRIFSQKR